MESLTIITNGHLKTATKQLSKLREGLYQIDLQVRQRNGRL